MDLWIYFFCSSIRGDQRGALVTGGQAYAIRIYRLSGRRGQRLFHGGVRLDEGRAHDERRRDVRGDGRTPRASGADAGEFGVAVVPLRGGRKRPEADDPPRNGEGDHRRWWRGTGGVARRG